MPTPTQVGVVMQEEEEVSEDKAMMGDDYNGDAGGEAEILSASWRRGGTVCLPVTRYVMKQCWSSCSWRPLSWRILNKRALCHVQDLRPWRGVGKCSIGVGFKANHFLFVFFNGREEGRDLSTF